MEWKPALTDDEFDMLKHLLSSRSADGFDDARLGSLQARKLIRRDQDGWAVTIEGHVVYLRDLATRF